jgi:predicted Na+-dependent transporter
MRSQSVGRVAVVTASRTQGFAAPDEVAAVLCGSHKSLVSGVPIASALFSGPAIPTRSTADITDPMPERL